MRGMASWLQLCAAGHDDTKATSLTALRSPSTLAPHTACDQLTMLLATMAFQILTEARA
jgi:hypothetical protein